MNDQQDEDRDQEYYDEMSENLLRQIEGLDVSGLSGKKPEQPAEEGNSQKNKIPSNMF